ncbi:hypothetical protein VKT23_010271 [Stygiomarasmius scandens]|uniref:CFEM domain-containing protein n=1 Tax=Marasmiellus scandens TaxID=2682957 RepID=A0ABR1JDD3_9AGAR
MFTQKFVAVLGLAAIAVHAQDISGLSSCAIDCITTSAASNGCSLDPSCICSNTAVQDATASCLQSKCSSDDLNAAAALQQSTCGSSSSGSGSGSSSTATSPSSSGSGSDTASSAGASQTDNSNNSAVTFGPGSALAVAVGVLGAVIGGGLTL